MKDTALFEVETGEAGSQWEAALQEQLQANKARTLVLQTQIDGALGDWTLTFRSMGGSVAAVLQWTGALSIQDLPAEVFRVMKESGFEVCRHLRPRNLRLIGPDGQELSARAFHGHPSPN